MSTSAHATPSDSHDDTLTITELISLDLLEPLPGSRPLDTQMVTKLAESLKLFGIMHPPTAIANDHGGYYIVDGQHRCASLQLNGHTHVWVHLLPEDTDLASLKVRAVQANHVRKDESLADTIRQVEDLMEAHGCDFAQGAKIGLIKDAYASKLNKTVTRLSPEALELVKASPSIGLSIAYYVAKNAPDTQTQLHWLKEFLAGRMSRDDIVSRGNGNKKTATKKVTITIIIDQVTFRVSMPKTITYKQLGQAIGKLKARFAEQEKLKHPMDLLPRLMAEAS